MCFTLYIFFFFSDTATTEIYTLSLHDALPICAPAQIGSAPLIPKIAALTSTAASRPPSAPSIVLPGLTTGDRKSTRLNSSHVEISYAVFCLKKKKKTQFIYSLDKCSYSS